MVCHFISGLHNPEEFSLTSEEESLEQSLKRTGYKVRNKKKLNILKKKLHTDEECKKHTSLTVMSISVLQRHNNIISEHKVI